MHASFNSGTAETVLPPDVATDETVIFTGVQRSFSIFTGTAGVFTRIALSRMVRIGRLWL